MHHLPIIDIGGMPFDLSAIGVILITSILVFVFLRLCVRSLSVTNPSKLQNLLEIIVGFVQGLISSTMDAKKGQRYIVLALTLIFFIFIGNMIGLPFLIITEHEEPFGLFGKEIVSAAEIEASEHHGVEISWWKSPTADLGVAMALAVMIIAMSHILGLFTNTKAYLKHYFDPTWVMFPLNVIKEISRLFTLGLRLWGNILAGEILIGVIIGMLSWFGVVPLVVWLGFSTFVATIQAFVFTVLTLVYISLATHDPHAEEH